MKKVYLAPRTEATEFIATTVLMASITPMFEPIHGTGSGSGTGDIM